MAPQVVVTQLSPGDDNLVIAAEGLLAVSPPKQIATLLQHLSAPRLAELRRAYAAMREQQLELLREQQRARASEGGRGSSRGGAKAPAAAAEGRVGGVVSGAGDGPATGRGTRAARCLT